MSAPDFRAAVAGYLARAQAKIPARVPHDVFDPIAEPMMRELEALDRLLFSLDADERDQEQAERDREHRVQAKRANPNIEHVVMRVDYAVQQVVEGLGADRMTNRIIAPIAAVQLIGAVVDLLEAMPGHAFAPDRFMTPSLRDAYDETVRGIVDLIHARKSSSTTSAPKG